MAEQIAVFRYSPAKLVFWSGFQLLVAVFFGAVALGYISGAQPGSYYVYLYYLLFAITACLTVMFIARLFQKGPILEITTLGIRDQRVSPDFLPWASVAKMSVYRFRYYARSLELRLLPDVRSKLNRTLTSRIFSLGFSAIWINATGLNGSFDDLLQAVRRASGRKIQ